MLKTGIYNIEKLEKLKLKSIFGKEKNISALLYNKIYSETDLIKRESLTEIILNRFNTKDNLIKRTYRNRFNEFDDSVCKIINNSDFSNIRMHDMAISDGRASVYLIKNLLLKYPDIEYTASDICVVYYVYFISKSVYLIFDNKSKIIEITRPPFVWNYERPERGFYFLNNVLKKIYQKRYRKYIYPKLPAGINQMNLLDNEFYEIIKNNTKFKIIDFNIFDEQKEQYDVIRAMNVIHYGYFCKEQVSTILSNVYRALEMGGLFIEGSNEDANSPVEGGVYQKTKEGFKTVFASIKPSRISEQIINTNNISISNV